MIASSLRSVAAVATDLLREASSRRWFLALALGITLLLAVVGLALRLEVVDGALAATRLFGAPIDSDIRAVDVALRPVFRAAAWMIFHGGLCFGILACADFAPSLLAPGRIEHLLALPLRRWELLVGTWIGVVLLACAGALYGAGGLAAILGVKTGVWTLRPIAAALLAVAAFAAVYAVMLAIAILVRSAALSAACGAALFFAGILASYRAELLDFLDAGVVRTLVSGVSLLLPRIGSLATMAGSIAGSEPVDGGALAALLAGHGFFAIAVLALAVWHFEGKDF